MHVDFLYCQSLAHPYCLRSLPEIGQIRWNALILTIPLAIKRFYTMIYYNRITDARGEQQTGRKCHDPLMDKTTNDNTRSSSTVV
jgi:hypothetical protein